MREQQVRHVCAGHQQQESHRREQDEQRGARSAGDRVPERDDRSILEEIVVSLARCVVNAPGDRADVSIRLRDRDAVSEARDRAVVMRRPARAFTLPVGRQPQIDVRRETKSFREHADDGEDCVVDLQVRL